MAERTLDVARLDKVFGGASVQGPFPGGIVRVESVTQKVSEQMVVPVGVSGQFDQEEVPVLNALEQLRGFASLSHCRATLGVELFKDRSREQEVEDLSGLAFEHFRSEKICDGAGCLRELRQEEIRKGFVAKRDGSHLDTRGPTLSAGREQLDVGLVEVDRERGRDCGDLGLSESELSVAHLEQLAMRTKSVQRELGFSAAAHDHTTAGRETLDERGQAR